MIPELFWLSDAQFSKILPHLPTDTRGKARVDDLFADPSGLDRGGELFEARKRKSSSR